MIVQEYIRENGSNPFGSWFGELDPQAAAKVSTATLQLELGNTSNVKWIGGGLGEYRIDWGAGLSALFRTGWRHAHHPVGRWNEEAATGGYRQGQDVAGGI